MENRHDQSRRSLSWQTEDEMMFVPPHPKRWKKCAHVFERTLATGKVGDTLFQPRDLAAHLRLSPLLASVADNAAQVGFSLRRENVAGQARPPVNSSSRISLMLLVDTLPANPS